MTAESPRLRHAARPAVALLLAAVLGLLTAPPAAAHTRLLSSSPTSGASVPGPAEVRLVFSEPVNTKVLTVVVKDAGDGTYAAKPRVHGATVTVPLVTALPRGTYTVAYRVVSADGHPISDTYDFTSTGPKDTARPQVSRSVIASPAVTLRATAIAVPAESLRGGDSGGVPAWLWIAVGLLAGVGGGLMFSLRKKANRR